MSIGSEHALKKPRRSGAMFQIGRNRPIMRRSQISAVGYGAAVVIAGDVKLRWISYALSAFGADCLESRASHNHRLPSILPIRYRLSA